MDWVGFYLDILRTVTVWVLIQTLTTHGLVLVFNIPLPSAISNTLIKTENIDILYAVCALVVDI